jgi:hypothetical protein
MRFLPPPPTAAWQHHGARAGFEIAYLQRRGGHWQLEGFTTAIEDGQTWAVEYQIEVDATWRTRNAHIRGRSLAGRRSIVLEGDGAGNWLIDGQPAPTLQGCLDIDLESSALTNALPVHRMGLPVGGRGVAPAAYVRAVASPSIGWNKPIYG